MLVRFETLHATHSCCTPAAEPLPLVCVAAAHTWSSVFGDVATTCVTGIAAQLRSSVLKWDDFCSDARATNCDTRVPVDEQRRQGIVSHRTHECMYTRIQS